MDAAASILEIGRRRTCSVTLPTREGAMAVSSRPVSMGQQSPLQLTFWMESPGRSRACHARPYGVILKITAPGIGCGLRSSSSPMGEQLESLWM